MTGIAGFAGVNMASQASGTDPTKKFDYAGWWGDKAQAPTAVGMPDYQSWKPSWMANGPERYDVTNPTSTQSWADKAPTYNKPQGGDYQSYQRYLADPGVRQVRSELDSAKKELSASMAGNGTYGSTPWASEMTNLTDKAMGRIGDINSTASANAFTAQRQDEQYDSQMKNQQWQSLMGYDQQTWAQKNQMQLAEVQAANAQKMALESLQAGDVARYNQYMQQKASWDFKMQNLQSDFSNMLNKDYQNFQVAKSAWDSDQNQKAWTNIMNFYGNFDPYEDGMKAMDMASKSKSMQGGGTNWGSLASGAGSLAGGLMSMIPGGQVPGMMTSAASMGGQAFNGGLSGTTTGAISAGDVPFL